QPNRQPCHCLGTALAPANLKPQHLARLLRTQHVIQPIGKISLGTALAPANLKPQHIGSPIAKKSQ
ncbi:MAG: hypothetical protein RR313_01090, partial [Anaerovoracaceae bacterium]